MVSRAIATWQGTAGSGAKSPSVYMHVSSTVWLALGLQPIAHADRCGGLRLSGQSYQMGLTLLPNAPTMFGDGHSEVMRARDPAAHHRLWNGGSGLTRLARLEY